MSTRIHRYQLPITDETAVEMPQGATVLSVHHSRTDPLGLDVWALVGTDAKQEKRLFRVIGTGNPVPHECGEFVGTVITHEGLFVWHVFDGGAA
jgi:hypothetical protein